MQEGTKLQTSRTQHMEFSIRQGYLNIRRAHPCSTPSCRDMHRSNFVLLSSLPRAFVSGFVGSNLTVEDASVSSGAPPTTRRSAS